MRKSRSLPVGKLSFEVFRKSPGTGFQRCGHTHRSRKAAEVCCRRHNKSNPRVKWRVAAW